MCFKLRVLFAKKERTVLLKNNFKNSKKLNILEFVLFTRWNLLVFENHFHISSFIVTKFILLAINKYYYLMRDIKLLYSIWCVRMLFIRFHNIL